MHQIQTKYDSTYDEALEMGLPMGLEHQVLPDGPVIILLRERTQNDRLFFYFHAFEQKYVLAAWVYTPEETPHTPICIEIEILGVSHPERTRVSLDVLAAMCKPVDEAYKGALAERKAIRNEKIQRMIHGEEYRRDLAKGLRKRGHVQEAMGIESGVTPVAGEAEVGSEAWHESAEHIETLARLSGMSTKGKSALRRGPMKSTNGKEGTI